MTRELEENRQAGVAIAEEMITAGARVISEALIDLSDGFTSPAEVAQMVYQAMERVARASTL